MNLNRAGEKWGRRRRVPPTRLALAVMVATMVVALVGGTWGAGRAMATGAGLVPGAKGAWTAATPYVSPPLLEGTSMAYDDSTGQLVAFGGYDANNQPTNQTWTYNGVTWTLESLPASPPPLSSSSMAFDPATGDIVLFGGQGYGGESSETWIYDGQTWAQQAEAVSPPGRSMASMTYDSSTGQLVLFGGYGAGPQGVEGDTWIYDAAGWSQQTTATAPSPRYSASMAYDPQTGQVVLVGGQSETGSAYGDTWTYDQSGWTQSSLPAMPGLAGGQLVYDPSTQQLLLNTEEGTVSYDGSSWAQQTQSPGGPEFTGAIAYDPTIAAVVLIGDGDESQTGPSPLFDSTWLYQAIPQTEGGYSLVGAQGGLAWFGDAEYYGLGGSTPVSGPVVGVAATATRSEVWFVEADGSVVHRGGFSYGSMAGAPSKQPIVGMAATPDGKGYWLVAADGGIFTFGDAGFYGSTGALTLNQPIVAMALTADGQGYWLVAADGGIFTFGDAGFYGSTGALKLEQPIVAMAATADGQGYLLEASDGGIFTFGDAGFYGSGTSSPYRPFVGLIMTS